MMLSSVDPQQSPSRCREQGIAAFLTKPVSQSMLLDTIMNVLSGGGAVPVVSPSPAQPQGEGLRVLLAEDNPVNRQLTLSLLGRVGKRVVAVENGREVLAALEREEFDLVLMDLQMPEMDGFQATSAIRERESLLGGHLPIIALTAHALKGDRERCLTAGMDGYVAKPIDPQELYGAIERLASPGTHPPPRSVLPPQDQSGEPFAAKNNHQFDHGAALDRLGGNRVLLAEIAKLFLENHGKQLADIRLAIEAEDPLALERACHTLKGSLVNFVPSAAVEAAKGLERAALSGRLEEAPAILEILEDELRLLVPGLQALAKEDGDEDPDCR